MSSRITRGSSSKIPENSVNMKVPAGKARGRPKRRSTSVDKNNGQHEDKPEDNHDDYMSSVMTEPVRERSCDSSQPKSSEESHDQQLYNLDTTVELQNTTEIGGCCSGFNGQHPSPIPSGPGPITPPVSSNKFNFSQSAYNSHNSSPEWGLHLSPVSVGSNGGGPESEDERSNLRLQRVESSSASYSGHNLSGISLL